MKNTILFQVLLAIVLGVTAGIFLPDGIFLKIYTLAGKVFLNALSLIIVPLVVSSIIIGTARMGKEQSLGSLGLKTLGFFVLTSLSAILIGMAAAVMISPGVSAGPLNIDLFAGEGDFLAKIKDIADESLMNKVQQIILKIVPSNIFSAAAHGEMLGLIVFSMLFGFFTSKADPNASSIVLGFFNGVFQVMMQITKLVIKALPVGVFALIAKSVANTGIESMGSVIYFVGTVLLGLFIYAFIFLPLLLKFVAGVKPWGHIKAMMPAMITAFSTTSSAATLPVTIECVEKKLGVSNKVSSFVLPLGISINLSGSSLYVCAGVIFIAQVYGFALSIPTLFLIVIMTLISSLGSAGIPSASMISIVVILQTIGLPGEGIGLIMAVERILDMFRTPVNVFGTSCCAVLVAKSQEEKDLSGQPAAAVMVER